MYKKGEVLPIHIYNYPWFGRFGCVAKKCIYCGTSGPSFQLSSHAVQCLGCPNHGKEPIPELLDEYKRAMEQAVNERCRRHNVDRERTIRDLEERYGPQTEYLTVVRDDNDVEEAFKQLTPEQIATARRRGFTDWQIKNWLQYDQVPGQPRIIPIQEGEPYVGPN